MSRNYPTQPIIGVGAIIWKGDQVLLVRQDKYPEYGANFWTLPGGGQEVGESVEQALQREVMEETGLTIEIGPLVLVVDVIRHDDEQRVQRHFTVLDFRCDWVAGEPEAADDVVEARWVPIDELNQYRLWTLTADIIRASRQWQGPVWLRGATPFELTC